MSEARKLVLHANLHSIDGCGDRLVFKVNAWRTNAAKAERDRYHADLMRELSNSSKKTEELAKLRQHAEAMAYRIENDEGKSTDIFYKRLCDVAAAYRADFPEDAK